MARYPRHKPCKADEHPDEIRRVRRVPGSAVEHLDKPPGWRSGWKEPKVRSLKWRQLKGLTRKQKEGVLRGIIDATQETEPVVALKAIEIDNRMRGHNEPDRHEHTIKDDFWTFAARKSQEGAP